MRLRALLEFSGGLATNFGLLMLAVLLIAAGRAVSAD
jgi:hypothetical protein